MRPAQAILLATLPVLALTPACDPPGSDAIQPRGGLHGDTSVPCGYRTQTQSQWGSMCTAGNTGCDRDEHFMEVFPEGLIVGCGVLTANLISSAAVEKALPSAGIPRALLPAEAVAYDAKDDPKVGTAFFGQVVALALNIGFDADLPGFTPLAPGGHLQDLVIGDPASPCVGMRVGDVLDEANLALGGCPVTLPAQALNDCAAAINKAFVDGETSDGGSLCSSLFRAPDTEPQ